MALESIQPLTEMCTSNISLGANAAGAYSWQIYHFHVPIVLKSGSLSLLEPSEPVQGCTGISVPFASSTNRATETLFQADSYFVTVYKNIIGNEQLCQQPPGLQGDMFANQKARSC